MMEKEGREEFRRPFRAGGGRGKHPGTLCRANIRTSLQDRIGLEARNPPLKRGLLANTPMELDGVAERCTKIAHGETVGWSFKKIQAPDGAAENGRRNDCRKRQFMFPPL
jgi:hypothetical protein